ncbi:hypothetical protein ILUMI_04707 [Ignelater luminosus]|uniref:aralkylamine N-acetyltransferase n=1 Tax=Ignelater luminosus TaxID=2038154 RepID=A0A8K0GH34_IGNLU|nr:hypothetical protein ILUMI_04707 [Ignelater luminosus]
MSKCLSQFWRTTQFVKGYYPSFSRLSSNYGENQMLRHSNTIKFVQHQRAWFMKKSEDAMSVPSTPSTPTSPAPEPYEIRAIKETDQEPVISFLRKFFFKDEPLNVAVKLIEFKDSTCVELEEFSIKSIKDGISLMAITNSGNIIGVCLNGKIDQNEPEEEEEECPNPKFSKILKLLAYAGKEGSKIIAEKYPDVEKIMFAKILSVDGAWRGKGIAKELMDRTRHIGREQGYGLMRVDCTSYFSARAIARLGFECVYELKYADYKENGQAVFVPEHPHNALTIYVQRISCTSP